MRTSKIEEQMRCYCALTVTAATAVVGAGVAAYSAYDQSQQAEEAQDQVNSQGKALYGSKVEPVPFETTLDDDGNISSSLARQTTENIQGSLPEIFDIAGQVQKSNMNKRQKLSGGKFKSTIRQEGANIEALLEGQVPQDVVDTVNRIVAENLGGSFDPTAPGGFAGGSATSLDLAQKLGMTSFDLMVKGMSYAPAWRASLDSFIYKPEDVMRDFWTPMSNFTKEGAELQLRIDEDEYVSNNNIARAGAMPDPQATGQFRDNMTLGALKGQADANFNKALVGLVNSGAAAYNTAVPPKSTAVKSNDWRNGPAKTAYA